MSEDVKQKSSFDLAPTRLANPLRQRVSVARAPAKRGEPILRA